MKIQIAGQPRACLPPSHEHRFFRPTPEYQQLLWLDWNWASPPLAMQLLTTFMAKNKC